jgi:hypothetical protein
LRPVVTFRLRAEEAAGLFISVAEAKQMGGGNKEKSTAQTNYNAALTTANQESPYEKRRREFNEGILNAAKSGDYRTPPPGTGVFFNFASRHSRRT